MLSFAPIRFAVIASLALSASLLPAQSPPTTPPPASSALPATPPTATAPPVPLTPSQQPPKRARITYADGTLSISADNSSLNQILHQISSDTGMKITGGVADERVFGQYGPAAPAEILAELLDGTGSNMILVHRDDDAPSELILSPRQGGPTPPNPNAAALNDKPEPPGSLPTPPQAVTPTPASEPITPPAAVTPAATTDSSPANAAQPDSPNGVKTPQQIYEQLQRMRQQQQQQTQPQQQPTQPQQQQPTQPQ
jgi:hypothetical protein